MQRTTIDLPDDLYRRAKATAAMRGKKLKDLVQEGLLHVLDHPQDESAGSASPTLYDLMESACGIISSGIRDLATNPKHMQGFGRD